MSPVLLRIVSCTKYALKVCCLKKGMNDWHNLLWVVSLTSIRFAQITPDTHEDFLGDHIWNDKSSLVTGPYND